MAARNIEPMFGNPGDTHTQIALIDCVSFYASCERVFEPKLRGRPIVVLCVRLDSVRSAPEFQRRCERRSWIIVLRDINSDSSAHGRRVRVPVDVFLIL